MQESVKKSRLATASLILGIFFFLPLVPILALIFAIIALAKISQSKEKIIGEGKAIAGLIFGGNWHAFNPSHYYSPDNFGNLSFCPSGKDFTDRAN